MDPDKNSRLVRVDLAKGCYLLLTQEEYSAGIRRGKARQRSIEHTARIQAQERAAEAHVLPAHLRRSDRS